MSEHIEPVLPPPVANAAEHRSDPLHDASETGSSASEEEELHNTSGAQMSRHRRDLEVGVAPDDEETWQSFLRRVTPHEISQREVYDPVRRGFVQNRHHEISEEARRRRRAATASTYASATASTYASATRHRARASTDQHSIGSRETRRRPMSLQLQERPLPLPPNSGRELPALPGEYIVPRWQPDYEAWSCPICSRDFSLFFRRHHCRKCGRVVCANCSPHRITIPRQFIVHPPGEGEEAEASRTRTDAVNLAFQEENRGGSTALGGGEEVRLCNPCVPDPNPLPPPSYISADGQHFTSYPRTEAPSSGSSTRNRHRASMPPRPTYRYLSEQSDPLTSAPRNASQRYDRWNGVPHGALPRTEPFGAATSSSTGPSGLWSPFGSAPTGSRLSNWPLFRPVSTTSDPHGPLPPTPPPPPPPMREEDECPVCHSELPARGVDGSETAREAHVIACIQSHFLTGARTAAPETAVAVAAASAASAATASQAAGETALEPMPASPRRRAPGMLVYHASEKDCVAEDGSLQECVICFEEFAVGDEMGRLECLCKFHRICIRQWWDTKAVGACPVHQDGI